MLASLLLPAACLLSGTSAYDLVREHSGLSFFDRWDFLGTADNLTDGNVFWVDEDTAYSHSLAQINAAGNAVIRVDYQSEVPMGGLRNSVRIASQDNYGVGSLWIIDLIHLPFGCSVWPAWWTKGPNWPEDGEIDIIEGINLMQNNQMALHTSSGCLQVTPAYQTGETAMTNCSTPSGCTVEETKPNSFQKAFFDAGGGVWAAQFDVKGIFIWFWSRPNVPDSIASATLTSSMDLSDWGAPSAAYYAGPVNTSMSGSCDITQFFSPQQLVLDITLCGNWAGLPDVYAETCGNTGPTGSCYADNVVGNGSNYADAYFEIPFIRTYTTGGAVPSPTGAQQAAQKSKSGANERLTPAFMNSLVHLSWIALMLMMIT